MTIVQQFPMWMKKQKAHSSVRPGAGVMDVTAAALGDLYVTFKRP